MTAQDSQSELEEIEAADSDIRKIIIKLINYVIRGEPSSKTRLNPKEAQEAIEAYVTTRVKEATGPLERILEKSDYGKCLECGEFYHDDDMVFCEPCEENGDNSAMHEWCAGTIYNGDGEYPAESAYALCKKHSRPLTTTTNRKEEK